MALAGAHSHSTLTAPRTALRPADDKVDGAFKAYAVSLPEQSELVDKIPEADPVLLYEVRCWRVCAASFLEQGVCEPVDRRVADRITEAKFGNAVPHTRIAIRSVSS